MAIVQTVRVLVIDPSFIFYQGIRQALGSSPAYQIEWAQDFKSSLVDGDGFDLALIGQSIDTRAALELCCQLAARNEKTRVVLISQHAESLLFQEDALLGGAFACLPSSASQQEFLDALGQVSRGVRLFREKILSGMFQVEPLTRREIEILERIAGRKTDKEIADALRISVNTVRNHAQNVLRKMRASDRDAAVWRARLRRWI
jgi:DNA-binding NarL/FixJ family response regulator